MTQILNVPMPADEAIKIIRKMYESNRMIRMIITATTRSQYRGEELTERFYISTADGLNTLGFRGEVIIDSITPIIPTYSVGDQVMILATGEIGTISKLRNEVREKPIEINNDTDQFYHRSEICKIA